MFHWVHTDNFKGLGVHWELWSMAGEGAAKGTTAMSPIEALARFHNISGR